MNRLILKKYLIGVVVLLGGFTFGNCYKNFRLESTKVDEAKGKHANLNKFDIASDVAKEQDFSKKIKNTPIQDAIFLFSQAAFSFYRVSNFDYKSCGNQKDNHSFYNLNRFRVLNKFELLFVSVTIILNDQKKSLCPIRPRLGHGPPISILS